MNQGIHPEQLPAEVLDGVAGVAGAEVTVLGRLPGGVNGGAWRVQLAGRADAVLKAAPRAHADHLDEVLRSLTPREGEVLSLMAEGMSNTAIARKMVVTEGAVEKHVRNIFTKLGLHQDEEQHRRVLAVLAYLQQ